MDPDGGWRYHDPHQWGPGHMYHHGPPPWMDGADVVLPLLSALFPLLLLMWVLSRWFLLDALAARSRRALTQPRDTVRPAMGCGRRPLRRDGPGVRGVRV